MDTFQNDVNRIKEVLEEKGVKKTWLAEQPGKSYNMVKGYVQNRHQPRLEVLFEIAKILGVKPQELLKEKNDKHSTKAGIASQNMENSQRCSWLRRWMGL